VRGLVASPPFSESDESGERDESSDRRGAWLPRRRSDRDRSPARRDDGPSRAT